MGENKAFNELSERVKARQARLDAEPLETLQTILHSRQRHEGYVNLMPAETKPIDVIPKGTKELVREFERYGESYKLFKEVHGENLVVYRKTGSGLWDEPIVYGTFLVVVDFIANHLKD